MWPEVYSTCSHGHSFSRFPTTDSACKNRLQSFNEVRPFHKLNVGLTHLSEGDSFFQSIENMYLHAVIWSNDLGFSSCLEKETFPTCANHSFFLHLLILVNPCAVKQIPLMLAGKEKLHISHDHWKQVERPWYWLNGWTFSTSAKKI